MKLSFLLLLFMIRCLPAFSQVNQTAVNKQVAPDPAHTYAVIIGIANYENKNIPNLNFPNKDAEVFADYLKSKAGGGVAPENIRLLIDANATTAAIYNALNWLREKCETDKEENNEKDDLIYFYFSGHGDMESETLHELGFLLSYNTPGNNYINNAVRLEDLNYYANTLSVKFNANVVLITDACHSGKLAGSDYHGSFLVGKELATAKAKEIRIAACAPEELSQENEAWGGGRGIFSYYLVNGLKGFADRNKDNAITLNEIQFYLDSSIANDAIMKENSLKQTPVSTGNNNFKIADVDQTTLFVMQKSLNESKPELSNQDYFFSLLGQAYKLEQVDYTKLDKLPKDAIALAFINQVNTVFGEGPRPDKLAQLQKSLREDKDELKSFNEKLADALHTRGQKIINLCLQGDAAELERRRYYNSQSNGYDMYPYMYAVALQLTDPDNPFYRVLKVNQLYFTGVAARLKIPLVEISRQQRLVDEALAAQKKALALEENAAYIHNELGILYEFKKEYPLSEKYFKQATALAPAWAIPWANLAGLYALLKQYDKGVKAGEMAYSLQPDLQITQTNLGLVYEMKGNWLYAEEFYRNAIDINSRHFLPFERLGSVYLNDTHYADADSFFHEADIRKRGYHFQENGLAFRPEVLAESVAAPFFCDIDTLILDKNDLMAFFAWGRQEYMKGELANALRVFKKVIALDKTNPLVFHYMGKIFYEQQKWEEAEIMFKFARTYYLDEANFEHYYDSVISSKKYPYYHECFELGFKFDYYRRVEDLYFLATLYESWSHYAEAEESYRLIIEMIPDDLGGYIKYWRMLEKLGRYTEAENLIQRYAVYDRERSERELNAFYRRVIDQFPDNGDWNYRLGLLLYNRADLKSKSVYFDTIIWFPKLNKEVFMDFDTYEQLGADLRFDRSIPGSPEVLTLGRIREPEREMVLPGILERVILANAIYSPRKDGIAFLAKADSLLTDVATRADINFKIGNLFVRSGSKKQAFPYYNKAVQLTPENAATRLALINVSKAIYKNRAALEQLQYLYDKKEINFPARLLLAESWMLSGQFDSAKTVVREAESIHPYVLPEIAELNGRLYLLSHQPAQAIPFYKNYLTTRSTDPVTLYTIARLYALSGNKNEAWTWLEKAMNKGFNYSYVLNIDPAWKDGRNTAKWGGLIKRFAMKKYPEPEKLVPVQNDAGK